MHQLEQKKRIWKQTCWYLWHCFYWPHWLLWQKNEESSYRTHHLPCTRLTFDVEFIRFYTKKNFFFNNGWNNVKKMLFVSYIEYPNRIRQDNFYLFSTFLLFSSFILSWISRLLFSFSLTWKTMGSWLEDDDRRMIKLGKTF